MGQSFLPIVFESQGLVRYIFLQQLEKLITRRLDVKGAPVVPLKMNWSKRLSLTLQRDVTQAFNIRMVSLYVGPTNADKMSGRESLQGCCRQIGNPIKWRLNGYKKFQLK